jgi:hypothetical protein
MDGSKVKCGTCLAGFKLSDDKLSCDKCSADKFGAECGQACSTTVPATHCDPDGVTCDSTDGGNVKCTGCKAGFHTDASTGGQCMTKCTKHKWGADCEQSCVAPMLCDADGGWECHSTFGAA